MTEHAKRRTGQCEAGGPGGERQDQMLRQQLTRHAPLPRAQRHSRRDLFGARV